MKFFRPISLLVLTILATGFAQEEHYQEEHHQEHHHEEPPPPQEQHHHHEVNCDAICEERVQQAVQPIHDEKVRAEEWGHGVRRELDEAYDRLRGVEEEVQRLRVDVQDRDHWVQERDQWIRERDQAIQERDQGIQERDHTINDLRASVDNAQRDLESTRREIDQIKHDSTLEIDELRTKAEESSRSLGRVQFALDEANDQIKEMESARISVNLKGINEDVRIYWKNLLGWWTGLVMPDKKKKEEDL